MMFRDKLGFYLGEFLCDVIDCLINEIIFWMCMFCRGNIMKEKFGCLLKYWNLFWNCEFCLENRYEGFLSWFEKFNKFVGLINEWK